MIVTPLSDDVRRRIEQDLLEWHTENSEARKRFDAVEAKWDKIVQPLQSAVDDSVRLTEKDLAIVINVR